MTIVLMVMESFLNHAAMNMTCEYRGQVHMAGDEFPAGDGCNTWYADYSSHALLLLSADSNVNRASYTNQ